MGQLSLSGPTFCHRPTLLPSPLPLCGLPKPKTNPRPLLYKLGSPPRPPHPFQSLPTQLGPPPCAAALTLSRAALDWHCRCRRSTKPNATKFYQKVRPDVLYIIPKNHGHRRSYASEIYIAMDAAPFSGCIQRLSW